MMRSMFSGVSGLRAHQTRMDVIGNNIANVNTVGFKSGRVTFQEIFSQTLRGAGAPDATSGMGGTNPMQVGLGLGISSIDTITTRGSLQRTDNPTDVSIEGDGFFMVKGSKGDTPKFTRAGNFGIDKLGNLVTGSGALVMGWHKYKPLPDGTVEFETGSDNYEGINLYGDSTNGNKKIMAAKATANAAFSGNLDASEDPKASGNNAGLGNIGNVPKEPDFKMPVTVYDDLGNAYKVNVNFTKCSVETPNGGTPVTSWYWEISTPANVSSGATAAKGYIKFNSEGKILSDDLNNFNTNPEITFTPEASKTGAAPFKVKLDFTKLTTFAADFSAKPSNVDGYPSGSLVTFSIGANDGIITGIYSNGRQKPLGMLALASFDNPAGLQKVGENLFIPTTNSGDFLLTKAGSGSVGKLSPGTLEMSNVDLSREFTEMIVTQRGFQANSRIITTSDEMLQELVNLKR